MHHSDCTQNVAQRTATSAKRRQLQKHFVFALNMNQGKIAVHRLPEGRNVPSPYEAGNGAKGPLLSHRLDGQLPSRPAAAQLGDHLCQRRHHPCQGKERRHRYEGPQQPALPGRQVLEQRQPKQRGQCVYGTGDSDGGVAMSGSSESSGCKALSAARWHPGDYWARAPDPQDGTLVALVLPQLTWRSHVSKRGNECECSAKERNSKGDEEAAG